MTITRSACRASPPAKTSASTIPPARGPPLGWTAGAHHADAPGHTKGNAMSLRVPARQPGPQATPIRRRTALLSGVALPLGLLAARATPATAPATARRPAPSPRLTLPAPTGRSRLGTTSLYLIDPSRPDPWVPTQRVRQLMIQLWYPADAVDGYPRAPYMTARTARAWEKLMGLPRLNWPITA